VSIDLVRVDERLIHGQVVVGWGSHLGLDHYVVVDDALADSEWEQELYRSALPDGVTARFMSAPQAIEHLAELGEAEGRGALLTRGTGTMRALAEGGVLRDRHVNLGGLHGGPGRDRVLDYVYLGSAERDDLRVIAEAAGKVSARDLPTAREVPLDQLLAR